MTMQNYELYVHDDCVYAVRENGDTSPELFVRIGQTENVRTIATADAVIYDDLLLDVYIDKGMILLQDPWSGIRERFAPTEWEQPAIAMFDRVEQVFDDD